MVAIISCSVAHTGKEIVFVEIDSLKELRTYLDQDDVKIRMKPGT
jgi:hypothetical protein